MKFLKKIAKYIGIAFTVSFVGVLVLFFWAGSGPEPQTAKEKLEELESLSVLAGFTSVQEYQVARSQGLVNKADYDARKKKQQAADDGGFLDIAEYQLAKSAGMPTKQLYIEYKSQQAELQAELQAAEKKHKKQEYEKKLKAKKRANNFKFESGKVNASLFCGNQQKGFEIFLLDDYTFSLGNILGANAYLRYGQADYTINALIVPVINGKLILEAMTSHYWVEKSSEQYTIRGERGSSGKYLNSHELFGHSIPNYYLYRDGSKVVTITHDDPLWKTLDATMADRSTLEAGPCVPIKVADPAALIAEHLYTLSTIMEAKYKDIVAEKNKAEAKAKF